MKPSHCLAFLHVDLMCSDQVRFDEMVTPRYFTDLHSGIGWLPMKMLMESGLLVRVMGRSCVLEWFGVRPWVSIQERIRLISC